MPRMTLQALTIALLTASCANGNQGIDPCAYFHPIYVQKGDVLSIDSKRAILAHDLTGQRLCGWSEAQ